MDASSEAPAERPEPPRSHRVREGAEAQSLATATRRTTKPITIIDLPSEIILQIVDHMFYSAEYRRDIVDGYSKSEALDSHLPVEFPEGEEEGLWASIMFFVFLFKLIYYAYHGPIRTGTWCRLDVWKNLSRLAATCKHLNAIVSPELYYKDICYNHCSALLLSAKNGNLAGARKSLEQGAYVDTRDRTYQEDDGIRNCFEDVRSWRKIDFTALMYASFNRDEDMIRLLLKHGAHTTHRPYESEGRTRDRRHPRSTIHDPVEKPLIQMRSTIQSTPPSRAPSLFDQRRANALYFLLTQTTPPCVRPANAPEATLTAAKLLIDADTHLITHTSARLHALHQACADWDIDLVRFLLEEVGVDVNVRDALYNTPLHFFDNHSRQHINQDHRPLLALLRGHGADLSARDSDGRTSLQALRASSPRHKSLASDLSAQMDKNAQGYEDGYEARRDRILGEWARQFAAGELDDPDVYDARRE